MSSEHTELGTLLDRLLASDKLLVVKLMRTDLLYLMTMPITFEEIVYWGVQQIEYILATGEYKESQIKAMEFHLNKLKRYIGTDNLEKMLICPTCGKKLKQSSNIETYEYLNDKALYKNVTKFNCSNCGYMNAHW